MYATKIHGAWRVSSNHASVRHQIEINGQLHIPAAPTPHPLREKTPQSQSGSFFKKRKTSCFYRNNTMISRLSIFILITIPAELFGLPTYSKQPGKLYETICQQCMSETFSFHRSVDEAFLIWDVTQRRMVFGYRRFGTTQDCLVLEDVINKIPRNSVTTNLCRVTSQKSERILGSELYFFGMTYHMYIGSYSPNLKASHPRRPLPPATSLCEPQILR